MTTPYNTTVLGDVNECDLCLGYSPGGPPIKRENIEPENAMDGLWRSSLDPTTNGEFYFSTPFFKIETQQARARLYSCIALSAAISGSTLADVAPSKLDCSRVPLYEGTIEQREGRVGIRLGDVYLVRNDESMTIEGSGFNSIATRFGDVTYDRLRPEGAWFWVAYVSSDNGVLAVGEGQYDAIAGVDGRMTFTTTYCANCPILRSAKTDFEAEEVYGYSIALDYERPITVTDGTVILQFEGLEATLAPTVNGASNFCDILPLTKGASLYFCFGPLLGETPTPPWDLQDA